MSLLKTIVQVGGQAALGQVAERVGLPKEVTSKAVGMILPALVGGLSRNVGSESGLGSLLGALTKGDHEKYLDEPQSLAASSATEDGNGILGHILGGKDASRAVASTVSSALGIENKTVKQLLPMVAALAMGGLAKQTKSAGLTADAAQHSGGDVLGQITGMLDIGGDKPLLSGIFGQ